MELNSNNKKDISREGITRAKVFHFFKLFLPKNTKTLLRLEKFSDLDLEKIEKLRKHKIKGIIVDVDECIAYNHSEILNENKIHLKKIHDSGTKIVLFSNMKKNSRYDDLESFLHVLTNVAPKPEREGFIAALKFMNLEKNEVLMIGDNYLTDGGAIQLGIDFIKIKPIKTKNEKISKKLKRIPDKFLRGLINKLSLIYEVLGIQ